LDLWQQFTTVKTNYQNVKCRSPVCTVCGVVCGRHVVAFVSDTGLQVVDLLTIGLGCGGMINSWRMFACAKSYNKTNAQRICNE
jgi:hypothetical protein